MKNALHELYLQLNYVCYEEGMSQKLASVWDAFYKLEEAFKNSHQQPQDDICPDCNNGHIPSVDRSGYLQDLCPTCKGTGKRSSVR
jgi:hypothetical protein